MCLMIERPAISRVGSGGRPGVFAIARAELPSRNRQSMVAASFESGWCRSTI